MVTGDDPLNAPLAARLRAEDALVRVRAVHDRALAELTQTHGRPLGVNGAPCAHAVLAVGPLATGELSPATPLGLLFLYETDEGHSAGARGLSPRLPLHAFFERVFASLTRALEASGYRLDLSVRPEGSAGPLCNSLEAMVDYLERFGGPDERRSLARAAVVAGDPTFGRRALDELAPFVFRRSLDAALVASLTSMPLARLSVADLVDTMAAGLGGRHHALTNGSTLARLTELARHRLLDPADAAHLSERHLRELTGASPPHDEPLAAIIASLATLTADRVPLTGTVALALDPAASQDVRLGALTALGFLAPALARERLDGLARHPDGPFHWRHAGRAGSLAAALIEQASLSGKPDQVLLGCEALTHLLRHQPHLGATLASDPARLSRLVALMSENRWAARRLFASPALMSALVFEARSGELTGYGEARDGLDVQVALAAVWASTDRFRAARELLDEARVIAAWTGDDEVTALELEVVAALLCDLAGCDGPELAPLLLLARRRPSSELDLAAVLPDDAEPEVRALLRRLVSSLTAGREGPLVVVALDPSRRPFSVSELRRHLVAGGSFPTDWQVVAGPPQLVDAVRRQVSLMPPSGPGSALPTAVMAETGPA